METYLIVKYTHDVWQGRGIISVRPHRREFDIDAHSSCWWWLSGSIKSTSQYLLKQYSAVGNEMAWANDQGWGILSNSPLANPAGVPHTAQLGAGCMTDFLPSPNQKKLLRSRCAKAVNEE